jgi:hypothetical protein
MVTAQLQGCDRLDTAGTVMAGPLNTLLDATDSEILQTQSGKR